LGLIQPIQQLV